MVSIELDTLSLLLAGSLLAAACATDDPGPDPMAGDEASSTDADETAASADSTGDDAEGSESSGDQEPPDGDTGADETTGGVDLDALFDCEDPNVVYVPMMGPGFDPQTGAFVGPPQESFVAHTTQAVVGPETMDEFMAVNDMVVAQLMQTEGVLGVGFAIEPACGFLRTIGLWESEQALYAFAGSGAHAQAMAQAGEISITGRTTHWTIGADAMSLTWDMALTELDPVAPSPAYD
ncbi:MAG: hypothetical protein KDK70_24395 [Myxococcales bacterium]|nr:hypothetical protein [Myxococcales bacterium]